MEVNVSDMFATIGNLAFAGAVVKLMLKMDRRIVVLETKLEGFLK